MCTVCTWWSGLLAILSKSIAIVDSDTAEKVWPIAIHPPKCIADSDTSKVSPIVSLSIAIIDINNPGGGEQH
jgi:hypothetical protein